MNKPLSITITTPPQRKYEQTLDRLAKFLEQSKAQTT